MLERRVTLRQNAAIFMHRWPGRDFTVKEFLYQHCRVNGVIESISVRCRASGELQIEVRANPNRVGDFSLMFKSRIRAEEWEGKAPQYYEHERDNYHSVGFSTEMPVYSSRFFRMIYSIQPDVALIFPQLRVDIPELREEVLEQHHELGEAVDVQVTFSQ